MAAEAWQGNRGLSESLVVWAVESVGELPEINEKLHVIVYVRIHNTAHGINPKS